MLDVGIVPEQDDEGEEGKVVVWSLEVGEQAEHYNCHEEFVNMFNHSILVIIFKLLEKNDFKYC